MELKEGMYVRTKKGIAKIIDRNDDVRYCYPNAYVTDTYLGINDDTEYIYEEDIIKASNSLTPLIDLIEVGDYVNGFIVLDIRTDNENKKYIECGCKDEIAFEYIYDTFYNKDIKSIVTKEQFESIKYSLEG